MNLYEVKEKVIEFLKGYGFEETDRAYNIIRALLDQTPDQPEYVMTLLNACRDSYDPDTCLLNFSHFIDHSLSPYSQLKEFNQNQLLLDVAKTIFSASNYLSSMLFIQPAFLYSLFEGDFLGLPDSAEYLSETRRLDDDLHDEEVFSTALNRFKMEKLIPIALRELFDRDSINRTAHQLSVLADSILETVYRRCRKKFPDQRLAIISMGKLGGDEVNFSSDLDLIFIGEERALSAVDEFGQSIVNELTRRSRFGYLFRVDMRLRPEGNASALVTRLDYFRDYLLSRARTWERQAYIRARYSAGDPELGKEAIETIRDFVFHSSLTIEDIRSIIFIKNEIDHSVRANPIGHVKKGRGGIRDIEFIVQAFQLIFGDRYPPLRQSNIFHALEMIYKYNLIPPEEYEILAEGYRFLRRIEHYLQLRDNRQVFELPKKDKDLVIIARLMGFDDISGFRDKYTSIREKIRKIFTGIFSGIFGEGTIADVGQVVINPDIDADTATQILSQYRFTDPHSIFINLRRLAERSPKISISLALSLHTILSETEKFPAPDKKFLAFMTIMERYGAAATFLKLIRERPQWRNIILNVLAESENLTRIVLDSPGIIDQLIDPDLLDYPEPPERMYRRYLKLLNGDETAAARKMKDHIFFITAVREMCGLIDSERAGYILSDTVDFLIRRVIERNRNEIGGGYAVLALGRLGCREVTFGSDADVVYIFRDLPEKIADYTRFFNHIPQFLNKMIEIDARLRPNGKNAPLAVTESGFYDYLENKAELWERSAYLKARVVACSDEETEELIRTRIAEFVTGGDVSDDPENIQELRRKIHDAYSKPDQFNLKKDSGGLMDIDFFVFMQIRKHRVMDFNHSVLNNLSKLEKIPELAEICRKMTQIYRFYRRLENIIRVDYEHLGSVIRWGDRDFLELITRKLELESPEVLEAGITEYRNDVSRFYEPM